MQGRTDKSGMSIYGWLDTHTHMETIDARIVAMSPRTSAHIHRLFALPLEQSVQLANGLLSLIESRGSECTNWMVVTALVEIELGKRLEWRNAGDKLAAKKDRGKTVDSYIAYLNSRRDSWREGR